MRHSCFISCSSGQPTGILIPDLLRKILPELWGRLAMKLSKFFVFVGVLFAIAVIVYLTTTPKGNEIPLTGIVTGNDVIVSSQIAGRMIRLTVDEGSQVHKGDLIAEIDQSA